MSGSEDINMNQTFEQKTYTEILKNSVFYEGATKILYWREPITTGLLFGIFNFFFFLITWGEYTVLTLISYLLLSLLGVCFGYVNFIVFKASWTQNKKIENPFKEKFKSATFHVPRDVCDKVINTIFELINHTIDELRETFYCTDHFRVLRFAGLFYFLAILGNWFSGTSLLYLVILFSFIWPRLYEEKKREIDQGFNLAKDKIRITLDNLINKLPPNIQSKLKPKTQ